jgi:hypothetical protein
MEHVLIMGRWNGDLFARWRDDNARNQHSHDDPRYNPEEMEHYTTAGTTFAGFSSMYLKYASATGVVINPE